MQSFFNDFKDSKILHVPIAFDVKVSIGFLNDLKKREKIFESIHSKLNIPSIIHPSAIIEDSAIVKKGCQVMAGAIIGSNVIVGEKEPYKYLTKSIDEFINQDQLIDLMKKNNFQNCSYRNLSGGLVAIHSGWKI